MKYKFIYLFLALVFILSGCSRKNRIIAAFKGGTILQKEFDYQLMKYPAAKREEIRKSLKQLEPILRDIAVKKISYLCAGETNIINISEISNNIFTNIKSVLINYLFNKEVTEGKSKVKRADILKFNSTLSIRVIRLLYFPWMGEEQKDKIYRIAKKIKKTVRSGTDFEDLANTYSSDPYNFKNGRMGIISRTNFSRQVIDQLKKLPPDQLSSIIRSKKGFHIFKMHQLKKDESSQSIDVSHILIKTNNNGRKRIEHIKELLSRGYDFSLVANEYTEDENNFRNGLVPLFNFSRIHYGLADAAYNTKPGRISDIVETRFGIFILKTENITQPDKKVFERLKKNNRYLNNIRNTKAQYEKNNRYNKLISKIFNQYRIEYNLSLLTNSTVKTDDVIIRVPRIGLTVLYKDCLPHISSPVGPDFNSDLNTRMDIIFKKRVFNDLVYDYAKEKKLDREDEFQLQIYAKFYDKIYQEMAGNISFEISVNEKELREYYKNNDFKYFINTVKNNRPARVKQTFEEARKYVKQDYMNEKRYEAVNKWKRELLKRYGFSIYFSRLDLKKTAYYYSKIGDTFFAQDKYKKARKYYLKSLKENKDAAEPLIKLMLVYSRLKDEKKLSETIEQVMKIRNVDMNILMKYLTTDEKLIKIKIIEMIGMKGNKAAETELLQLYWKEKDVNVLQSLVRTLGMLRSDFSFPIFFGDLKNFNKKFGDYPQKDKEVLKWNLIEAIGLIGNKESTDYLISLIKSSKDMNLKCIIAEALGGLNDKKAVPVLEKLVNDENEIWGVRMMAAESLKKITGETYKVRKKENEAL